MKKLIQVLICWVLFMACYAPLQAQQGTTTFSLTRDTVNFGTKTYVANVKVKGFTNLISTSLGIVWDSTVLKFDSVSNFGMRLKRDDNFGVSFAPKGQLRFLWQEGVVGVSLRENTTLFSIHFKVIGRPNSKTNITFDTLPFPVLIPEAIDANSNEVKLVFQNGAVFVKSTATTSVFSNQPENIRINKAYPNPFSQEATIEFNLRNAENVGIEVVDLFGKIVHREQKRFSAGKQQLILPQSVFPSSGTYFVRLSQGTSFSMQQVIYMAR
jgi:Secretion system C-terminal sorting domain